MDNLHKHDGYMHLAVTAFIDGLHFALRQLVNYKKFNTEIGIELHWLMSNEHVPRTFLWYCDVFNVNPERIRAIINQDADDYIYNNKELPKYKIGKLDQNTKGTEDTGE